MVQAKDKFVEKTPEPRIILQWLRSTAKSYAGLVPGASYYVDETFNSIDQLADTHNEELDRILSETYNEMRDVVQNGNADQETAMKVFSIVRRRSLELQDLTAKASSDFFGPFLEKHPELREKLGGSYDQVKELASKAGPEARRISLDTAAKLKDVFKSGLDSKSIDDAKQILQEAADRLQKAAGETGSGAKEAWDKSMQQAQPYLDKIPDIKDLLNNKASVLMNGAAAKQIWDRVKEIGQGKKVSKEKVDELKEFIKEKAETAGSSSDDMWDKILEYSKMVPGSEKVCSTFHYLSSSWEGLLQLEDNRKTLQGFVAVVREDSDDAKALAKETFDEVMKVIDQKADKAKSLKEKVRKDTEKEKEKK